jgi:hypothetical protein
MLEDDIPGQKRSAPIDFDGESQVFFFLILQLKEGIMLQFKLGRLNTRLYFTM